MIKKYTEWLNESAQVKISRDLALIALKRLIAKNDILSRTVYFSKLDRERISKEWGKRLPKGFAGPETPMTIGDLLGPAIHENPRWDQYPYFDDADLVFGDWPLVFKCKVENKQISSRWKELSDWIFENFDLKIYQKYLETDISWNEFLDKYKGAITGKKFGL